MAAALVGGAFLSASLQVLFERLSSPEVLEYLRGKLKRQNFDKLREKLETKLPVVAGVLDDAEQKQMRKVPGVDKLLDYLEEAYYDADDLLDEIEPDALQLKVEAEPRASSSKVCNLSKIKKKFRSLFSKSRNTYGRDMESKIKRIFERLEDLKKLMDALPAKESTVGQLSSSRLPSTSLVEASRVYGRDEEKGRIVNLLLSTEEGSTKLGVIPIVGMGGLGKTTLAQLVYNDEKVVKCFELKAWICVSEQFDIHGITKTMLQSIPSSSFADYATTDLNMLQVKLKEKLVGKKFLIVLDDVWNEKPADWDNLSLPFKGGAPGSKIIVTTRSKNVARIMGTIPALLLGELTEDDCWRLFANASGFGEFPTDTHLERTGRKIVDKCKRLPLAIKTLGSLLRSKLDVKEWESILNSDIWELYENRSEILPALRLSYHHLPSHLKRCFAYCSIFPKDYVFEKENLVLLWMAQNLLPTSSRDKRSEEWGEEYFNDLVSRSFLQPSTTRGGVFPFEEEEESAGKFSFVMHDLVHDLAISVAKKFCLQLGSGNSSNTVKEARHLAYIPARYDPYKRFNFVSEASHLRTFLPTLQSSHNSISTKVADDLLLKLRCLRVLSFSGYASIQQLPDSIGEQRHLRYLDLSFTSIKTLPESVCMLYNLQTLKLYHCTDLVQLPKKMHRLIKLRYLDVRFCDGLLKMPTKIGELKYLQLLSKFIVGRDSGNKIGELKELPNLHGELRITNLENVVNPKHALEQAKLMDKKYVETLKLQWSNDGNNDDSTRGRDVLDILLPNTALKRLKIDQYPGIGFPNWVGCNSFVNMVFVELSNCRYCLSLPPLGQLPSLKTLHISEFDKVVTVGHEFYGSASFDVKPFSSLEVLTFRNMSSWEKWIQMEEQDVGTFKKLRELEIWKCDKLTGDLPSFLPSLTKLKVICGGQLAFSLPRMPSVSDIEVAGCKNEGQIKSLFEALKHMESSLRKLRISYIVSSIDISGYLPTTLEALDVFNCKKLEYLLNHQLHESLQKLFIASCFDSLGSLPLDSFPKLQYLCIYGSEGLESLSVSDGQSPSSLSSIWIHLCPSFVSFPKGGLHAPNLTSLYIHELKKLKSLPEEMHDLLPRLNTLMISDCPEIESFPKGGLPFSLSFLDVENCHKLVASRASWNLQRLPNLSSLSISGKQNEDVESFPEEGLLPTTITRLYIEDFRRLKALDENGLQQLTSLKSLRIEECPELQKIPVEGLPTTLKELHISKCPLLEKKCKRDKGKYWNKSDRIFCVTINGEIIS